MKELGYNAGKVNEKFAIIDFPGLITLTGVT